MIKAGLLGAFFVVSSITFAQELTVKSYSLSFFEEAPKPNESFTDVEDPFELRIPRGGFRAGHSSDPFGGAFGDPFGGDPFGDAEASTNAPPTGMDMGDKAIRTFNLLGAAVPETSRAVSQSQSATDGIQHRWWKNNRPSAYSERTHRPP